jgi:hypothetical protein
MRSLCCMVALVSGIVGAQVRPGSVSAQDGGPPPAAVPVMWLIFVDDLHLDFRNTGRLRDLLRSTASTLVRDGDAVTMLADGPSGMQFEAFDIKDRQSFHSAIKLVTGNALKPSDIIRSPDPREARYRAQRAVSAARALVDAGARTPRMRAALLYVSNGYSGNDGAVSEGVATVREHAFRSRVPIFSLDPRLLYGKHDLDALVSPEEWAAHWTSTRSSLRSLVAGTGGLVNEEGDELSAVLRRIAEAVRDAR